MKGSVFKLHRCPDCAKMRRVAEPAKKAPPCPSCGSPKAYYSDWCISYMVKGKAKMETVSEFKSEAEKVLAKRTTDLYEGKFKDKGKNITWEEATKTFLEYKQNTAKSDTYRFYKERIHILNKYFYRNIKYISEITPIMVSKYVGLRRKKVTNTTINRDLTALKHMLTLFSNGTFTDEFGKRYLERNVIENFKPLQENDPREILWEPNEIRSLIENATHPWIKLVILLAVDAALRKRTINWLKISYLQMDQGKIALPASSRKKGKYTHYVDMTSRLQKALEEHLLQHPKDTEYLFPNKKNKDRPWSKLEQYWQSTKKKLNVKGKRFHDMRATGTTFHYLAIENVRETSLFADHQDINMTQRYIRIAEARKKKNMEAFEKIMET